MHMLNMSSNQNPAKRDAKSTITLTGVSRKDHHSTKEFQLANPGNSYVFLGED